MPASTPMPMSTPAPAIDSPTLKLPEAIQNTRIRWAIAAAFLGLHGLALAALVPWLFTWSGLLLACAGCYLFGTLGINMCYHRLLTHRSFTCPRWLERALTILGACNLQGSSIRWVCGHRMHHQHSDDRPDPHSPLVNFLWSHVGWLLVSNPSIEKTPGLSRYAADLCRDPFHMALERHQRWIWIWLGHVVVIFAAGMALGWILDGPSFTGGVRLGLSWVVWAVGIRLVVVWHITWAINSVTHLWGYRNYRTRDNSRNNWLLGYIGMGEGWHNNHHANQRSAIHGHKWWELDITYTTIWLLQKIGLASNIIHPHRPSMPPGTPRSSDTMTG